MSEFKLFKEIIELSESDNWQHARNEWHLREVYFAEEPDTCLCGHYPIIELCIVQNRHNSNTATVGNCCVKKFLELPSDKIFTAVKRVRSDEERSLNAEAIEHAYENGWINDWENDFYNDVFKKRKLSAKQLAIKVKINMKILARMSRK